jgi:hypothetical protein
MRVLRTALKDTAATAAALDASPPKAAPHGDEEGAAAASKEVQAADGMDRVEVLKRSHSKDKDKGVEASAPAAESSGGKRKGDADADSVPASKKRKVGRMLARHRAPPPIALSSLHVQLAC